MIHDGIFNIRRGGGAVASGRIEQIRWADEFHWSRRISWVRQCGDGLASVVGCISFGRRFTFRRRFSRFVDQVDSAGGL